MRLFQRVTCPGQGSQGSGGVLPLDFLQRGLEPVPRRASDTLLRGADVLAQELGQAAAAVQPGVGLCPCTRDGCDDVGVSGLLLVVPESVDELDVVLLAAQPRGHGTPGGAPGQELGGLLGEVVAPLPPLRAEGGAGAGISVEMFSTARLLAEVTTISKP